MELAVKSSSLTHVCSYNCHHDIPDPLFSQPALIMDQILAHLSFEDTLKAMYVSPAWCEFISESKTCVEKLKVIVYSHDFNPTIETIEEINMSPIRFENLAVIAPVETIAAFKNLFVPCHKEWKQITFLDTAFENLTQALNYFEGFENSIVELSFNYSSLLMPYDDVPERNFSFPKLKRFNAKRTPSSIINAFKNAKHIEELSIYIADDANVAASAITSMLKGNTNLKSLTIHGDVIDKVFSQDDILGEIKFKLQTIEIKCSLRSTQDKARKNFANFINAQRDSLTCVTLFEWMGLDVLSAVYDLPNLEEFNFHGIGEAEDYINWSNIKFSTNNRIKFFHLTNMSFSQKWFKPMVSGLAQIDQIYTRALDQDTMVFMGTVLTNLRGLEVKNFTATDLSDKKLFPLLDKFAFGKMGPSAINDASEDDDNLQNEAANSETQTTNSLQKTIMAKKADDRSRLEELFLAALSRKNNLCTKKN